MYCVLLLILLHSCKLKAQDNVFTINKITLRADPPQEVENGKPVTLYCSVDISKSEHFQPNYTFSFSRNENILFNYTSEQNWAQYTISKPRFSDSGEYECTLSVEGKTKSSDPLIVKVKGIRQPKLTVQKTAVMEGEKVSLRCEVPEETPPFYFTFYKIPQSPKQSKRDRKRGPVNNNFAEMEFPIDAGDSILYFECTVRMDSVAGPEISKPSNKTIVTVTEPFSKPKITILPPNNITEGDQMCLECTTVLGHPDQTEIIIQKDKKILNSTKGKETVTYCKVATMEDNGNYICKAELGSVSKINEVNVGVAELFSKPILILPKEHWNENSWIQIECRVNSPQPIHFSLLKDNRVLANSSIYNITARVVDSGNYVCKAEIKGIAKESKPVQIRVYAPVSRPVLSQPVPQVVVLGKPFYVSCYSNSGTLPITYILYRGDVPLKNKTVGEKNSPASFQVKATDVHVPGEYRCHAQNGHSITQQSIGENITAIAPVVNINLTRPEYGFVEDGQDLSLFCTVGSGSFPIEFNFFRENSSESLYRVTETEVYGAAFYKKELTNQDGGKYFCTADNQAKLPLRSKAIIVKVVLASWKKSLIAAVLLLILLAVGIAGLWWYLHKKAKGRGSSMELASSRPETNSMGEKLSSVQNNEREFYYGSDYNEDGEKNHITSKEDNKDPDPENSSVEYTEVEVSVHDHKRAPVTNKNETVYTEIRKPINDAGEHRHSRIEDLPDGT
ncbi:platelet endothelial cell adhesion molecule isoform X2 [Elgaria multicarinata webbii]|uniref:platelet endothelial cell adhesion molecule isoform X2 n=1 Tax=Elgaria multicarinata webbii TaxID=159646 RepID=UPI002FCD11FA